MDNVASSSQVGIPTESPALLLRALSRLLLEAMHCGICCCRFRIRRGQLRPMVRQHSLGESVACLPCAGWSCFGVGLREEASLWKSRPLVSDTERPFILGKKFAGLAVTLIGKGFNFSIRREVADWRDLTARYQWIAIQRLRSFMICWKLLEVLFPKGIQMLISANKSVETNRRHASPFNAGRQFESASCDPPSLSAAVAHLWRWPQ